MNSTKSQELYLCPICKTQLQNSGDSYSVDELFELWIPIHQFSKQVIEEHRSQSQYTEMYSCSQCQLEIFLPQIIGTPNFYEELQKDPVASYYVDDKWDFDEALKDAKVCNSVIEIGCGPGNFLVKVNSFVSEVFGTEYNEPVVQVARNKGLTVFGPNDDTTEMKGNCDAAFSFHVLEHVSDPVSFVQELCSWVKPGGKVGISVPDQNGPMKYINPCIMNMPPHHSTRWRLQTFESLAKKLDLKIERVAYEPLLLKNHSYYSVHWLNQRFPNRSFFYRLIHKVLSRVLGSFFSILMEKFGMKYFSLLQGQAIYVLMSKTK